jgi:hypothetical protein
MASKKKVVSVVSNSEVGGGGEAKKTVARVKRKTTVKVSMPIEDPKIRQVVLKRKTQHIMPWHKMPIGK